MKRKLQKRLISSIVIALPLLATAASTQPQTSITEAMPATGDEFGSAQSNGTVLSANGHVALIAAPFAAVGNAQEAGKAYIYRRRHGTWRLMDEIDDPDDSASDNFGYALALSANGRVALIGSGAAADGQSHAGKAYVFAFQQGHWVEVAMITDPALGANDFFGYSGVALSENGNTALIGAFGTTVQGGANAGEAYVFHRIRGGWEQVASLPDPDHTAGDFFGYPVALSGDHAGIALIGSQAAVNGQGGAGKAYLYTRTQGNWSESHEFDDPAASAHDFFGDSGVALSRGGEIALIGAVGTVVNGNAFAGQAYVFQNRGNDRWVQTAAIPDPDQTAGDAFGYPVTMTADGEALLIGSDAAVAGQPGAGKAYLFGASRWQCWDRCMWKQIQEFYDPKATAGDNFGDSGVALVRRDWDSQYTVFISAYGTTVNNLHNAGEAYFYKLKVWP